MDVTESILESLTMLTVNKLRTGLAALGIIIGIGSVIALISLGQSSQKSIENQIQSLGANLLTVYPTAQQSGNVRAAMGTTTTLTLEDAKAIESSPAITTIKTVSPEITQRTQVIAGRNNTNTQVVGVYPSYAGIHKITLDSGSFISTQDVTGMSKVAVIGPQVASDLFSNTNPIGQTLRISGQTLKVIGITVTKGGGGFQNQDDVIYVPLSTAQKQLFGMNYVNAIAVEADSQAVMTQAQDQIGYLLLSRHKLTDPTQADFSIFSQNDIMETASQVTGTFTTLLGGIAAISLVVGGIGIMNIMLVTVTERTREIGLRKALGAKRRAIITQFLTEAVALTLVSGILGMITGIIISLLLARIMNLPFTISPASVLLAVGVSGGTGILFGWYPAMTAAKLQPIEALRYE